MINRKRSVLSILSSSTLQSNVIIPTIKERYDYLCKIIIIGPSGCGKTCLLRNFLSMDTGNTKQTIGVEFHSKIIELQDIHLKLQLWDTAGQERFKSITTSYYRGSAGCVLCFDLTNEASLSMLESDVKDVRDLTDHSTVSCVVVGNKCDLTDDIKISQKDVVDFVERARVKYELDISMVYDCSSVTDVNVREVFETVGLKIVNKVEAGIIDLRDLDSGVQLGNEMITNSESNMNIQIRGNNNNTDNSGSCCY